MTYYSFDGVSVIDYFPFGMVIPERSFIGESYRFAFNVKEKDDEGMGGSGSTYGYGFRIYPQLGKFLRVDPIGSNFPWNSPYAHAENDLIRCIDLVETVKPM